MLPILDNEYQRARIEAKKFAWFVHSCYKGQVVLKNIPALAPEDVNNIEPPYVAVDDEKKGKDCASYYFNIKDTLK